jgi:regulator of protease activity HflC (stomatin/prohibitin superfamily)
MNESINLPALPSGFRATLGALKTRLRERLRVYSDDMLISGFIFLALLVFLLPSMVITIPAGHLGVLWKRFGGGTVINGVTPEGTTVIFPWDRIFIYDARLQSVDREFEVLSSDGLQLKVDVAWRYRLIPDVLGHLHQYAGPEYAETLLAPSIGARARDVIAVYRPEDIYTEHRLEIQSQISESVRYDLKHRFNAEGFEDKEWVLIEDVLIKRIVLPKGVQDAIVRKNIARHEVQEHALYVEKEREESERKRVEALGIRNFQEIVNGGMSESYLRWRGIEATLELARSNNAKVVVIGNSKTGGLPLISISADAPKLDEVPGASTAGTSSRDGSRARPNTAGIPSEPGAAEQRRKSDAAPGNPSKVGAR